MGPDFLAWGYELYQTILLSIECIIIGAGKPSCERLYTLIADGQQKSPSPYKGIIASGILVMEGGGFGYE